jgi:AcrR family transcriptional regulator
VTTDERPRRGASAAQRATGGGRRPLTALRRQPRQARGRERVGAVLDACERLLARQRHDEITIEDIAREAGTPVGSLYHFFPDRTAIYLTALERLMVDEAAVFAATSVGLSGSLEAYLSLLQRRLSRFWRERRPALDLYLAYQHHPTVWAAVLAGRAEVAAEVARTLRRLRPAMTARRATAVGEQIGIVVSVMMDNLQYVAPAAQRRLRRECLTMIVAYVKAAS